MGQHVVTPDIQDLVDGLAERLCRPVGVDDRRYRAIAYSSHDDDIDAVRRTSILGRQAPEQVTRWLDTLNLVQADDYVRVPARPDFDMVARVCFPLRFHNRVLGFLWLVEKDGPLADADIHLSHQHAAALAESMLRLEQQHRDERLREARAVEGLTIGTETAAAAELAAAPTYGVIVIAVHDPAPTVDVSAVDLRLLHAIDHSRRAAAPRHQLAAINDGLAVVILACTTPTDLRARAKALMDIARRELADIAGAEAVVGVGRSCDRREDLPTAHREALLAARIGAAARDLEPPVFWEELGADGLIADLLGDRDAASLFPQALQLLLAAPDAETLVTTLSVYLDYAGLVSAAAAELFVHRSTLYHRLHRIEEITGTDTQSGADRLELHVGLRLLRLSGRLPR